jgi:hypothetical protein
MDNSKMKYVYVISGKGERKFWNKVGVAFVNRDGSLNCKLESLPIDGELHIRDYTPKDERASSSERELSAVG